MDSFIRWIGGKRVLRKEIMKHFPSEQQYDRYIEVFGGAGWILFAKERTAKMEVFNDINGELVNLYRCVKYHDRELQKELKFLFMSREQFFWMKGQKPEYMTDIQRAARFYILIKESYGCDLKSFGVRNVDILSAVEYLETISVRLSNVVIENRDFEKLINTYDRETALFYIDPPYFEAEQYYAYKFSMEDHLRLKEKLDRMKGMFILSYNDCEAARELYKEYNVYEVRRQHNFRTKSGGCQYKELIIKNFNNE